MPPKKRSKQPTKAASTTTVQLPQSQKKKHDTPSIILIPSTHSLPTSPPHTPPSPYLTHASDKMTQLPGSGCPEQPLLGGGIIAQQQKELELMIIELQDRDTELNSLVEIQQRQATVWAEDRRKMLELEQRCIQLQDVCRKSDYDLTQLKTSLSEVQYRDREKTATIHTLQLRLKENEKDKDRLTSRMTNVKEEKTTLHQRLTETERKLVEVQKCLHNTQQASDEMAAKLEVVQRGADEREKQLETLHTRQHNLQRELNQKEEQELKLKQELEFLQTQLITSSVKLDQLKTEVMMAGECNKRKDKLLQLQRSKLERHMREMDTLKKMCGHQDQQIAALQKQLQDVTHKHSSSFINNRTQQPPSPSSLPLTQECVVRGGGDELTQLLDSVVSSETLKVDSGRHQHSSYKNPTPCTNSSTCIARTTDHRDPLNSSIEDKLAHLQLLDTGHHDNHHTTKTAGHHDNHTILSKTAVVSPQKLVAGGNSGCNVMTRHHTPSHRSRERQYYVHPPPHHSPMTVSKKDRVSPRDAVISCHGYHDTRQQQQHQRQRLLEVDSYSCGISEAYSSSPLASLDLEHLAEEVREKIDNIFNTPHLTIPPTHKELT